MKDGFDAATDYVRVAKWRMSGLSYDLKFDKAKRKTINIHRQRNNNCSGEKIFSYLANLEFSGGINGKGFILTIQMQIEHGCGRVSLIKID
jgi:hypothetical protein